MRVAKIDNKQSWMIEIDTDRILVNPTEIDPEMLQTGRWSMAGDDQKQPAKMPKVHLLLVSSDAPEHFSLPALKAFGLRMPIFTTPRAAKKLKKAGFERVMSYEDKQTIKSRNTHVSGFSIDTVTAKQAASFYVKETVRKATAYIVPFGARNYPIPNVKNGIDFFLAPSTNVKRLWETIADSAELTVLAAKKLVPRAFAPIGDSENLPFMAKLDPQENLVKRGFLLAKLNTSILTPIPGKAVEIYRLE